MYHGYDMGRIIADLKTPTKKNFILDTDTYNEIDDQFAITYAMLADNINLLALTAAPFLNLRVSTVKEGQDKSYDEMVRVRDFVDPEGKMGIPCYRGADDYMPNIITPRPSEAAENIVRIVKETDGIVYIGMIGCFTNIASALMMDPSIMDKVVILMIGSNKFEHHNCNDFNLMQDRAAARVIFECGVPVVVLPAVDGTERLYTTAAEVSYYLKGRAGKIGDYLCKIFVDDEGEPDDELGNCNTRQRSIWDLGAVAAVRLADEIGRMKIVPARTISADGVKWREIGDGRSMIYVEFFDRNRVMSDFFTVIRKAYLK